MPLESLLELVQILSSRIDRHGPALRQSEALTRYALIDPLLRELGWDTADPDMVIPEYRSGNGRADYALMNNGSPAMMVEAKSLGTPLQDSVLAQGINYCLMEGTSYFSVTDGRLWEIYETHKPVPINDKQIVCFDLKDDPGQVCLKALALWQPSVMSGQVSVGQTPILTPPISTTIQQTQVPTITQPTTSSAPVVPVTTGRNWRSLSVFDPVPGSPRPSEIMFPDNSRSDINLWNQIPMEVTRWLLENNLIDSHQLPIPRGGRYILSTSGVHKNGKPFTALKQVGHLYLEVNYNSTNLTENARLTIQHLGQDPAQFKVRLP